MKYAGFIGPSYTLGAEQWDAQRTVNLYPEINELGTGKDGNVAALISTPGLRAFASVGSAASAIRGIYTTSGSAVYVASGNGLYSLTSAGVATLLGNLQTNSGPVSMADNGVDLMAVDGEYGYTVTLATNAFARITDVDFHGGDVVAFLNQRFIINWPDTGKFYWSGVLASTFDALDFATAEGSPDDIISLLVIQGQLWLFGTNSFEVWANTGDSDSPFALIQGSVVAHGCLAAQSPQILEDRPIWLGRDRLGYGMVWMGSGYQAQRVSTLAVEKSLQSATEASCSTATAFTYQSRGHNFYVLNLPDLATTWVFDASTGQWHERTYTTGGQFERHRANCHALGHGKHLVGDYANNKVYELAHGVYTDDGAVLTRLRRAPHLASGLNRVTYNAIQFDMEVGVGIDGSGQGSDPEMMLRWSTDGCKTWSNEQTRKIGPIGNYRQRVKFTRLGASRVRTFEVKVTDPVYVAFFGAEIDAKVLRS